jgi:hypothetical protein
MPSIINSSTSSGLITTGSTDGSLALQTGGTTALTISSAQAVSLTNALPIASGGTGLTALGSANQVLSVNSGGTALAFSTPSANLTYVTPVNIAYQNLSAVGYFNLGSISIPSSGDWRIYTHLRWGSASYTGYTWIQLSNSSSSGGLFGYPKLQLEKIQATASNLNIGLHSEFIVSFGTGCTFPYTLYILAYQSLAGTLFIQNDVNGYNQLGATKLASTASSASSPVQIGY